MDLFRSKGIGAGSLIMVVGLLRTGVPRRWEFQRVCRVLVHLRCGPSLAITENTEAKGKRYVSLRCGFDSEDILVLWAGVFLFRLGKDSYRHSSTQMNQVSTNAANRFVQPDRF